MFERVEELTARLSACLESDSGLDDAGRIDAIRALEELVCVATAAQAALAAELDEAHRDQRGVAAQVALARRESPHRGQRHLSLARVVRTELPHTWTAWRTGRITEWKATVVARETACLSREDRALADAEIAADADRMEAMGARELAAECQKVAYEVDAESFVARRRKAESERFVSLRPAPDCMTWLTALLPVKDGVAVHAALRRAADAARGAAQVRLNLVMTDTALLGDGDEPAHLDGYGPIPAELAREIVVDACTRQESVWVRRLYTSPETGELVAADARSRLFPSGMARFVRLRDQTCRTPWCDAPIRHIDHAEGHTRGGATSAINAQGLCEACSYAKEAPGWSASGLDCSLAARPPNVVETTLPSGHTYVTRPPALARIRRTPITIDFVLAG